MVFKKRLDSPVGSLTLESDGHYVTALRFEDDTGAGDSCDVLEQAARELEEYFCGMRREFTVPLAAKGTSFQRKVWAALQTVPYGETVSYADIAQRIGMPKACRAVGGANNRNPLPILIPCHRVVGKNGKPVGYAFGLDVKEFLLKLEQ